MERAWNDYVPEGSASDGWKKTLSLAMRRKQYDRVATDAENLPALSIEVPEKGKPNLRRSRTTAQTPDLEALGSGATLEDAPPPTPSVWGKARDAYVNMMVKTADDASTMNSVPAERTLDRSLTLGSGGFGRKVEVPETSLPFKLTKAEQQYLDHLRRRYDSRYA